MIASVILFALFIPVFALMAVYAERKVSAFIQDRLGPMEVGPYGLLQTFADVLKLLMKEDIVPASADKKLFKLAPVIIFVAVFTGFAIVPVTPTFRGAALDAGLFFVIAIVSLDVIGILMAGWASNSKFSMYGAMRGVSQIVSYEVPLGLSVLAVAMACQSLDLQEISLQQGIYARAATESYLLGLSFTGLEVSAQGGFLTWNIFRMPILLFAFVIYFIASLAECNRAPFDIPEAESELIGGFHTEYSGMRWAFVFLGEYALMLLVSLLAAILFLGSWNTPLPNIGPVQLATWTSGVPGTWSAAIWGVFWLFSKAFVLVLVQMLVRWTYPRLRVDQLMHLCWKVLTPMALATILITAVWQLLL